MAKQLPSKLKKRIQAAQEWDTYKVGGIYIKRVPVGQEPKVIELKDSCCFICFSPVGCYHVCGCSEEWQDCCGKLTWDCKCEAEPDDAEGRKDNI